MFTESKITEIYCLADDFCKEFTKQQEKYMLEDKVEGHLHRNKPNHMSDSEIMTMIMMGGVSESNINRFKSLVNVSSI